jgi:hypothetical protein
MASEVRRFKQQFPDFVVIGSIINDPDHPRDDLAEEYSLLAIEYARSGVDGREDYQALHAYPFDGREFYLTEFAECRDNEGFYQRQRLVVIDGEPVLRGSLYDQDWKVHGASRLFMMEQESWDDDRARSISRSVHTSEAMVVFSFASTAAKSLPGSPPTGPLPAQKQSDATG